MKSILILLLSLTSLICFSQSNPTITITESATTKQVMLSVKKSEVSNPPVINIGPSPYGNEVTSLWLHNDSAYYTYITLIYIPHEPSTVRIKAKDFLESGGTIADAAGNTGVKVENSEIVGFYSVGDWMKYAVNLSGKTEIMLLFSCGIAATPTKLEVRKGSVTGPVIAELVSTTTGAWNTWIEKIIPITGDNQGLTDLFFVISGTGNAYWGNLDVIEFR